MSTIDFHENQICYSNGDRSLLLVNHLSTRKDNDHSRITIICWDVKSRMSLHHFIYDYNNAIKLAEPILPIMINDNGAVLLCVESDVASQGDGVDDNLLDWKLKDVYVFLTISYEGRLTGMVVTKRDGVVHGVSASQVIFLKDDRYLWAWDGKGEKWQLTGRIHRHDVRQYGDLLALGRFGHFGERR